MDDLREKVIKGLEHEMCNRGKCGHYCHEGIETVSCEFDKNGLCIQHWGKDALSLLKAQEPVKWIDYGESYKCSCCGVVVDKSVRFKMDGTIEYCPHCGRKVKCE